MHIFDIIGPVMIGPSSSHTAGAAKIGYVTRKLLGERPVQAEILLHGSFSATGSGHGTDRAIVAGLLGYKPDDERLPNSFVEAEKAGLSFQLTHGVIRNAHPNTTKIHVIGENGNELEVVGSSIGGGRIKICEIDGICTNFSGEYNTIIVHSTDTPGHVAQVTTTLAQKNVNIATMQLYRNTQGGYAVMILECDDVIPKNTLEWLQDLDGIIKVTSYNVEEEV